MRVLFIARTFPPTIGGMERVAYELLRGLSETHETIPLVYSGSKIWLPLVVPALALKAIFIIKTTRIDVVYLQDGLLAPLAFALYPFNVPVVITIHGLDWVYANKAYQFLIPRSLRKADRVVCVSENTLKRCVEKGVPRDRLVVIPNGVGEPSGPLVTEEEARRRLEPITQMSLTNRNILMSLTRIVERKGIHWFVAEAMPLLKEMDPNILYLIAGKGPLLGKVADTIQNRRLHRHVRILGQVDEDVVALLYQASDMFVMPNIPVRGDIEGFGISVLEANSYGLPVVAANVDALPEVVQTGINGELVPPFDSESFANTITGLLRDVSGRTTLGRRAREYVLSRYPWEKVEQSYTKQFEEASQARRRRTPSKEEDPT